VLSRALREIEAPAVTKGASIIDAHRYRVACVRIGHLDGRAHRHIAPRPSGYDEAVQICEAIPAGPSFEKRQRQMVVQVAKLFDSMNAQAGVHVSQVDPRRS
jgi:hypothetical protein